MPDPPADSIRSRPPTSPTPLAHPDEPEDVVAPASGSKPEPSSSTTAATASALPGEQDADVRRLRVLDDVRERLLHDPVERRLDLGRQPLVPEVRLEVDPDAGLLPERLGQALDRRASPKSSSADGRSSTASRRTSWSVETTSLRTEATAGTILVRRGRLLERLQPEQDRRQRLPVSSWSSRARRLRSSSCACDDAREDVAADPLRRGRRRPRPASARLSASRRSSSLKRRVRAGLVVRDHDSDRAAARDQRDVERRVDAEPPRRLLVDLRILEHRVDALAAAPLEHTARLRAGELQAHADDAVGAFALGRRDRRRLALGSAMSTSRASTSSRSRPATSASSGSSSSSDASAVPISFSDSSWRSHRVDDS